MGGGQAGLLALRCGPASLRAGETVWAAAGGADERAAWGSELCRPQLLAAVGSDGPDADDGVAAAYVAACRRLLALLTPGGVDFEGGCGGWLRTGGGGELGGSLLSPAGAGGPPGWFAVVAGADEGDTTILHCRFLPLWGWSI